MKSEKEFLEIAISTIGMQGRMIGYSKTIYRQKNPNNFPIFNANIVSCKDGKYEKIWWGDLDLTLDNEKLKEFSKKISLPIYVLREMDARFETEEEPVIKNYVYFTDGEKEDIKNN